MSPYPIAYQAPKRIQMSPVGNRLQTVICRPEADRAHCRSYLG
jgi:hypothetical protein